MKILLILFGALFAGFSILVAVERSMNISGERSPGFPESVAQALSQGQTIELERLAQGMQTVCLVPEYTDAFRFLNERSISNPPDLYVGELTALIVFVAETGRTEYLGLPSSQAVSVANLGKGCASISDSVWQPVEMMEFGDQTSPIYAQITGERLR
jgi:hypothetical protein